MRRHKYNAKKTTVDGITFDSKREASRYIELKLLQQAGIISNLKLQPRYQLQPKFKDRDGNTIRAIYYQADFEYYEDGQLIVEDTKGFETKDFKLKKKLFLYQFPKHTFRMT